MNTLAKFFRESDIDFSAATLASNLTSSSPDLHEDLTNKGRESGGEWRAGLFNLYFHLGKCRVCRTWDYTLGLDLRLMYMLCKLGEIQKFLLNYPQGNWICVDCSKSGWRVDGNERQNYLGCCWSRNEKSSLLNDTELLNRAAWEIAEFVVICSF